MKKTASFSCVLSSAGFFTALICLLVNYPSYYTTVLAPALTKQGFFKPMFILGGVVAALSALFFTLIRKKLNMTSANKNIPMILFGALLALLPMASPYGLSVLLGERVHWLTPTSVGNGFTTAYVFYLVAMGFAGGCLVFVASKLHAACKNTPVPLAVPGIISLFCIGFITYLPRYMGYDRLFYLMGALCAVTAVIAMAAELLAKKKV